MDKNQITLGGNMDYKELYEELFELSAKKDIAYIVVLKEITNEYMKLIKTNKKLSDEIGNKKNQITFRGKYGRRTKIKR